MTHQDVVLTIWLVGAALITLGFIFVIMQVGQPAGDAAARMHASHVWQARLFTLMVAAFVIGTWATLRKFPIPAQGQALGAPQTVEAVGRMWSWELKPDKVNAASEVEFRVTSADVNHGFAIYAPNGRILTQTQAMPGYTNRLLYTFDAPGTYTVQCLEYCGIGHGPMTTHLEVLPAKGQ